MSPLTPPEHPVPPSARAALALALAAFAPGAAEMYLLVARGIVPAWAQSSERARTLFLLTQGTLLLILLLCTAAAGELFGRRQGAAGRADWNWIRANVVWLAPAALVVGILTFLFYDVPLHARAPRYHPASPAEAAARFFGGALTEEVVFRYGVLSLCLAATRRFALANGLAAAVAALAAAKSFGVLGGAGELQLVQASVAFAFSIAQGYCFRAGGLAACALTHAVVSLKLFWFAW